MSEQLNNELDFNPVEFDGISHPTPNTSDELDEILLPLKLYCDPTNSLKPIAPDETYDGVRAALIAWRDSYTNDKVAAALDRVLEAAPDDEHWAGTLSPGDITASYYQGKKDGTNTANKAWRKAILAERAQLTNPKQEQQ